MGMAVVLFILLMFVIGITVLASCAVVYSAKISEHELVNTDGKVKARKPSRQMFTDKAMPPKVTL
jgi:hypothetical protein